MAENSAELAFEVARELVCMWWCAAGEKHIENLTDDAAHRIMKMIEEYELTRFAELRSEIRESLLATGEN